jgi:hypothetical protein
VTVLIEQSTGFDFDLTSTFTVDNPTPPGALSGRVFSDENGNGVFDTGVDLGENGVTVEVWDSTGTTLLGSDVSAGGGLYQIGDLIPGEVRVEVDETAAGEDTTWSTPTVREVTVTAGTETTGVDFGWASTLLPSGRETDIEIIVGRVETLSGDGVEATEDGSAATASFNPMGGISFFNSVVYLATDGAVRAVRTVNEFTGSASTLAGHPTSTGCVDSEDPTEARFGALSGAATDGVNLYLGDVTCGTIRRVQLNTGATSTLATLPGVVGLVFAWDGSLYAVTASKLYQVDLLTGATTELATASTGFTAISADTVDLWLADGTTLKSRPLAGGALVDEATTGALAAIESVGDLLLPGHARRSAQRVQQDRHHR